MSRPNGRYAPIESYGIIGDLQTVALVGLDGGIDFLCLPRFDSPSVFLALLDAGKGGTFAITPDLDGVRHKQIYLPDTNILLTRFLSEQGVAEISDFMPIHAEQHSSRLVRRVKAVRGEIHFRVRCAPRFDYAREDHTVTPEPGGVRFTGSSGVVLRLSSTVPLRCVEGEAVAEVTLPAGATATFILEQITADTSYPTDLDRYVADSFKDTMNFWRGWVGLSTYSGRWRDEVHRSALALKLLHCRWSGSLVAAATFGLPETIGGERNWDYRYTWIRDSAFTMYALTRLGMTAETKAFIEWLARRFESSRPETLQTLYALDGQKDLTERTLDHLEGYRGSRPVRIGNGAADQLQLDIYGELLDALYLYDKYGEPASYDLWGRIAGLVEWVCDNWQCPDEGVWEVRSGRRDFLYSRILCWVAIDRGIRLAVKRSFPAPLDTWRAARDAIYRDVFESFWDPAQQAFVGVKGTKRLDAACLIMPLVRFISPTDPRWLSTLRAVEQRLVTDSLVFRYEVEGVETDGLKGVEGTFSICSFWYIECLSRAGDLQRARFLFEKMLGYANHVGLYAEEVGPAGEHLGNFPQAFTHLALISAAYDLDRRLSRAGWRA
ncbi:MAG: glycoside hydrolase family 15 protein [Gemmatimonadales bacterium]|nr:glycoside hydrolase family 15 protein [Gemmatimonadales bacterium]MDQ3428148.1 glycoside hydrolase family 15 protein [Gemmatimonadota bacterium]